ncbi:PQQ-dependent sugar dehydrogenase [Halalkalibacter kiskunsagensis]|uniref:PQQ-dependent sugar dehydrogenase n=1 Tax=Halalkalibacter kiskunsagensis TaxID=1548599 RepID=A0ABV6KCN4_9BACI
MKFVIIGLFSLLVLSGCQSEPLENNQGNEAIPEVIQTEENGGNDDSQESGPIDTDMAESRTELNFLDFSTEDWEVEVISDDLNYPWDIKITDNTIVMTEIEGTIAIIQDGQLERYAVQTSDPVVHDGGSGLLGIELAEDFSESGIAYLYYSYSSGSGLSNKVVEVEYDGNSWLETNILVDGIPGHQLYNGGRIAIGPDGYLYVLTGWANVEEYAQDLNNLAGKVLRLNVDGSIPEDNSFADSYVYSYGHRNPQGIAWNEEGALFISEHGPSARDEINVIEPGRNYGWPEVVGGEEMEGMEMPLIHSGDDTWAPSGITFFEGHLFVTGLRGQSLYVYNAEAASMDVVFTTNDRLRTVVPIEGDLYVITTNTSPRSSSTNYNDRLIRLSPRP